MGYDQMEREFPCPCGKGTILASWEEHDTWPSPNRSIDWAFKCSDCEKQFCFGGLFSADYILRLEDAEKAGELRMRQEKARNAVYDFAGPLYEEKWLAYVGSLGTKRAMNDAIGGGGYGTFLKKSSRPGWVEEQAKIAFRVHPKRCLDLMKADDVDVNRLTEQAEVARKNHDDFWRSIPKINVPFH